jgi:hypothetical protein
MSVADNLFSSCGCVCSAACSQAVSNTMQQLLQCLLAQQHLSRTKAALGLLLNCTDAQPHQQQQQQQQEASPPAAAQGSSCSSRALLLVQDHLLGFLTPKDLAADELQLPLLAALSQAAQGGGWGGAVQPLAALLAACCPSSRCLDTLGGVMQVGGGSGRPAGDCACVRAVPAVLLTAG